MLSIFLRVLNRNDVPNVLKRSGEAHWSDNGIEFADHALAVMKTRAETRTKLGTSAPTMKADALRDLTCGIHTLGLRTLLRCRPAGRYGPE